MELAQETNLEELLRKMMAILIENAGAQNGSLILCQNDRWFLEIQGSTESRNRSLRCSPRHWNICHPG